MERFIITCNSKAQSDLVFDKLEEMGEEIGRNHFGYDGIPWNCVGFYKLHKKWTIAKPTGNHFEFTRKIKAEEFLNQTITPNYEIY